MPPEDIHINTVCVNQAREKDALVWAAIALRNRSDFIAKFESSSKFLLSVV